ncbi:DUF2087 domain-containing protein [Levilactobacillus andaensis]|uniref:DUF2087 domain-containing protein n=1 Tax=Levilactobacillus andaensis TaxID=2799570 RepID=UPI001941AED8|nr:DUF2087 domain-containing protein [Levilactobacillus andaensis]
MTQSDLTLTELKQGWHQTPTAFICNTCQATFATDEVFAANDKFYPADQMIRRHVRAEHPHRVTDLINDDSKYNTLTAKQRDLLEAFHSGLKDADIAKQNQVAAATVRHQKFTFREKAKQARLYLAIYDNVFDHPNAPEDQLLTVPEQPGSLDDRFIITQAEYQQNLKRYLTTSGVGIQLKRWPKKQKAVVAILSRIIQEIPHDQHFTEAEITAILKPIFADHAILRRSLIEYGYLDRTTDGTDYWRVSTRS